jgi:hypothetical protein
MQNVTPAFGNSVQQGDIFSLPFIAADQIRDLGDALTQMRELSPAAALTNDETYELTPPAPGMRR